MRRFSIHGGLAALLAAALLTTLAAAPLHAEPFTYKTQTGITCKVTADGLTSVRVGDRPVAAGAWRTRSGAEMLGMDTGATLGPIRNASVSTIGERHARVRHEHEHGRVVYDYVFEDGDLTIHARVSNDNADAPLRMPSFGGLTFTFDGAPAGVADTPGADALAQRGRAALHPSMRNAIGGAYAATDAFGVGLAPLDADEANVRLWWRPTDTANAYQLRYFVDNPTPAEGTRTYQLHMRFSDSGDWKHLLTPWKRALSGAFGSVDYDTFTRPLAYHEIASHAEAVSEDNPLGYASEALRLDQADAAKAHAERITPMLQQAGAMGVIYHGIGGYDEKGLDYSSNFIMAPEQVRKNLKTQISASLNKAGLITGVTGNPDRYDIRVTRDRNAYLDLNPDDPSHLNHMWKLRFKAAMEQLGVSAFLFPDFARGFDDGRMMRHYRDKLPGSVPTLAARFSDALLFAPPGLASVRAGDGGALTLTPSLARIKKLQWLVPGASFYARIDGLNESQARQAIEMLYQHGIVPVVGTSQLEATADMLASERERAVDNGAFKGAPGVTSMTMDDTPPAAHDQPMQGESEGSAVLRTPDDIAVHVSAAGLNKITLGDRVVAEGQWHMLTPDAVASEKVLERAFRQVDDKHVRVTHRHKHVRVDYDYQLNGEDLTVIARVSNNHPSAEIEIGRFGTLTFTFTDESDESQLTKHSKWGWLNPYRVKTRKDMGHMHPGWRNRMGGSYGADGSFGIGATPLKAGFERTWLRWAGGWSSNEQDFSYHNMKPVPAGGARTFGFRLRLSTNTEWKHLLQVYKDYVHATYGTRQYETDHRFSIMCMAAAPGGEWVSEDNPHGYGRKRHFDEADMIETFTDKVVNQLETANGKGIAFWALGGYQPRGLPFRTDYDILPEATASNLSILNSGIQSANREWGVCVGRGSHITYRWKWPKDNILPINADDPDYVAAKRRRFQRMMDHGATLFYIDAFGHQLRDVKMMHKLRDTLPPHVKTYAEHPADITLTASGAWMGIRHKKKKGLHIHWGLGSFWRVANWLVDNPGSMVDAHIHPMPDDMSMEDKFRWMLERKLSPIQPIHTSKETAKPYRNVADEYLTPDGQWKPKAGKVWQE